MQTLNKQGIVFLGDTHGDFNVIKALCSNVNNYVIIHVGDVGLGFNSKKVEQEILSKKILPICENNQNDLFLMRGNHDSKKRFLEFKHQFHKIHFPEDYEIISVNNKKIMFVGGATSIDRVCRIEGKSYWEDEKVIFKKDRCQKVDILVNHTAPSWCYPQSFNEIVYGWAREDAYLIEDLTTERTIMDEIFKLCQPSVQVYGHFHTDWCEEINGCKHKLLDINEAWELR